MFYFSLLNDNTQLHNMNLKPSEKTATGISFTNATKMSYMNITGPDPHFADSISFAIERFIPKAPFDTKIQ